MVQETLASADAAPVVEDNFHVIASAVLAAYDSGELQAAINAGGMKVRACRITQFGAVILHAEHSPSKIRTHAALKHAQDWIKALGKAQTCKGKRLFMPVRIAVTGNMHGPDVGEILALLAQADGAVKDTEKYVPLSARMDALRAWLAKSGRAA